MKSIFTVPQNSFGTITIFFRQVDEDWYFGTKFRFG